MAAISEQGWLERLMFVGRSLVTELDVDAVLQRVLDTARDLTDARYAALGVLDGSGTQLERFMVAGVDNRVRELVGDPPVGRGILGALIDDPRPLRLADLGADPRSVGIPAGHPPMATFLGVPIAIHGHVWGNLYLTEKAAGEFTAIDEQAAVILAEWAAVAIENARLFDVGENRRRELERAARAVRAVNDISLAAAGVTDAGEASRLVAERARSLLAGAAIVVLIREDRVPVVRAALGADIAVGTAVTLDEAEIGGGVLLEGERAAELARELGAQGESAIVVPLRFRGRLLAAIIALPSEGSFESDDLELMRVFAASAANLLALARSVRDERLRTAQSAAEAERARWARELHDETLQGLAALRLMLSRAGDDPQSVVEESVGRLDLEIENLRAIITDLRPAALDEFGLRAALQALIDRVRGQTGIAIDDRIELGDLPLRRELELGAYRIVQEAVTNIVRHAGATHASVSVTRAASSIELRIADDGEGFDPAERVQGFGLEGMRERAELAGGSLEVDSSSAGTALFARLPIDR
jgi:signal transduction histidine kinase